MESKIFTISKIIILYLCLILSGCKEDIKLSNEISKIEEEKEYITFNALVPSQGEEIPGQELFMMDIYGENEIRLVFGTSSDEDSASWSSDGNKILFSSVSEKKGYLIYIADIKKKRLYKLKGNLEGGASWSPDGKKIIFTSARDNPKEGVGEIYIIDANGKNQKRLTFTLNDSEGSPRFFPDGKKIVFTFWDHKNLNSGIYTMNIDGTELKRLTNNNQDDYPVPSPDGKTIAFYSIREQSKYNAIYLMNSDGSNIRKLLTNGPEMREWDPCWSPDGSKIVFEGWVIEREKGKPMRLVKDLYIVDKDGKNLKRLTFTPKRAECDPSWRPRPKSLKKE
ncbi:MAG: hypothetical protein AB1630_10335 [bacterium]